jgi:hypothetical protein
LVGSWVDGADASVPAALSIELVYLGVVRDDSILDENDIAEPSVGTAAIMEAAQSKCPRCAPSTCGAHLGRTRHDEDFDVVAVAGPRHMKRGNENFDGPRQRPIGIAIGMRLR